MLRDRRSLTVAPLSPSSCDAKADRSSCGAGNALCVSSGETCAEAGERERDARDVARRSPDELPVPVSASSSSLVLVVPDCVWYDARVEGVCDPLLGGLHGELYDNAERSPCEEEVCVPASLASCAASFENRGID